MATTTTTATNNFERVWVNEDGGKGEGWGVGNVVSKRGHPGVWTLFSSTSPFSITQAQHAHENDGQLANISRGSCTLPNNNNQTMNGRMDGVQQHSRAASWSIDDRSLFSVSFAFFLFFILFYIFFRIPHPQKYSYLLSFARLVCGLLEIKRFVRSVAILWEYRAEIFSRSLSPSANSGVVFFSFHCAWSLRLCYPTFFCLLLFCECSQMLSLRNTTSHASPTPSIAKRGRMKV